MSSTMFRRRLQSLTIQEVDGDLLVLDAAANRIHQLNRTASFIWRSCDTATAADEIAERLAAEFEVDARTALADVLRTLEALRAVDLLAKA